MKRYATGNTFENTIARSPIKSYPIKPEPPSVAGPKAAAQKLPKTLFYPPIARFIAQKWGLKALQRAHLLVLGVVGLELGIGIQAYWMFHQMNTNQEYREKTRKSFPWALDKFYLLAEYAHGNSDVKKNDYEKWGLEWEAGK